MKAEIVGVGHSCLDFLCTIENYPPEDGSTHILSMTSQGGGAAATALCAASRLGARTAMIGCIGDDANGQQINELLAKEGVDTSGVNQIPGGISSTSYVMIDTNHGTRTKFPYPDVLPDIPWNDRQKEILTNATVLHIDGTKYDNALQAARLARQCGVTVSLDGCHMDKDNAKNRELASLADILIMNAKYPLKVTGETSYNQALKTISSWGPKIIIATLGNNGCVAIQDNKVIRYPAFHVRAVDTTGAGDVFHGAFLFGWLKKLPLEENIRFASAVAAMKCEAIGGRAGIPDLKSVHEFLDNHKN